jgi:hypothetical protein
MEASKDLDNMCHPYGILPEVCAVGLDIHSVHLMYARGPRKETFPRHSTLLPTIRINQCFALCNCFANHFPLWILSVKDVLVVQEILSCRLCCKMLDKFAPSIMIVTMSTVVESLLTLLFVQYV